MPARTEIHFRDGEYIIVEGAALLIEKELRTPGGGVSLVTIEGAAVCANWANVLYVQEMPEDSPPEDSPLAQFGGPPG